MPNDTPDWTQGPQTFPQALYPEGTTGQAPPTASFTCAANSTVTKRFALPTGATGVTIMATAGGLVFTYQLFVGGHQTNEQYFGDPSAPGSQIAVPVPTLPVNIPVLNDWDTELDVVVIGDASNATSYFVSAVFDRVPPGQAGGSTSVTQPVPSSFQAVNKTGVATTGGITAGTTFTVIGAGGTRATTRLKRVQGSVIGVANSFIDVECPAGIQRHRIDCSFTREIALDFDWLSGGLNSSVVLHNTSAVNTGAINLGCTGNQS